MIMCWPAAGAEFAGPAVLVEAAGGAAAGPVACAVFGAAASPHPATAPTTATGRTTAKAARRKRDNFRVAPRSFCIIMEIIFPRFSTAFDPADIPLGWGV